MPEILIELPQKIEVTNCKQQPLSGPQEQLYLSWIANWQQQQTLSQGMEQAGVGMLGLLDCLKLICAHPAD